MLTCTAATAPHAIGCVCHTPAFARLNGRLSRRSFLAGAAGAAVLPTAANSRIPVAPAGPVVFSNVRVFDGMSEALRAGLRVIVEGQTIKAVEQASGPAPAGAQVIDGGGRVLMPGLIDAHYHLMMAALPLQTLLVADIGDITLAAAAEAERLLLRGFTTIRDMAGPAFPLKRAIDAGLVPGPRIFPSGAMISQTSGHGDFRLPYEIPSAPTAPLSRGDQLGAGAIADGVPEVLKRAREQLMLGASQLKLSAGGGVASNYDPLDVSQYTEAEFRAAVDAAENWGTYVAVHAYTPRAIQMAIRSGVACIEHGQMMDEATARMIADKGIWLSTQPFTDDGGAAFPEGSPNRAKQLQMIAGTDTAYGLAKQHRLKTAWGTDILFDARAAAAQGQELAKMARWYSPAEALRMATGVNAELLAMAGPRNPYPGKLGVVAAGAYADLLLVNGDPTADLGLLADAGKGVLVVMKDGRFFKNTLGQGGPR